MGFVARRPWPVERAGVAENRSLITKNSTLETSMSSTITRKQPNRRNRRMSGEFRPAMMANQIGITSIAKATSVMTITFNQAVSLDGVPKYTTSIAGVTALSAV